MPELTGQCHCGAVLITVPEPPSEVTHCNCSLCRQTGWRGGYWHPDVVTITAASDALNGYVQGDRMITMWNCKICGSEIFAQIYIIIIFNRLILSASMTDAFILLSIEIKFCISGRMFFSCFGFVDFSNIP